MKKTTSRSVRELCDMTTPGCNLAEIVPRDYELKDLSVFAVAMPVLAEV